VARDFPGPYRGAVRVLHSEGDKLIIDQRLPIQPHAVALNDLLNEHFSGNGFPVDGPSEDLRMARALLIGLRACEDEIAYLKKSMREVGSEYQRYYKTYYKFHEPWDRWQVYIRTGEPYRALEALIVLGYCLSHGKNFISEAVLYPISSLISQIIKRDFKTWFHAMRMRLNRMEAASPETGPDSLFERALSAIEYVADLLP